MYFYGILKKMNKINYCKCFTVCANFLNFLYDLLKYRMSLIRCRQYSSKIVNGAQRNEKKCPKERRSSCSYSQVVIIIYVSVRLRVHL